MMKDVDDISHYVDSLVYHYIITASCLYSKDVVICVFAYCFDVFVRYNTPHHITTSDALSVSVTTSTIHTILTLFRSPIKFLYYF